MERMSLLRCSPFSAVAVISLILVACDPGITIRQTPASVSSDKHDSPDGRLAIAVEPTNQLIGETWYAPKFEVANSSSERVTVVDAQLVAIGAVYANQFKGDPEIYPVEIQPGEKKLLGAKFELNSDVKTAFSKPAELRVIHKVGQKQEVATALLAVR